MTDVTLKKLAGYTTLAAAGLAAEPAVAGVISSGPGYVPVTVGPGQVVGIDFGSGVGSVFKFSEFPLGSYGVSAVIQRGPAATGIASVLYPGTNNNPSRLGLGYGIDQFKAWIYAGNGTTQDVGGNTGHWNGTNGIPLRGFLGIRFNSPALTPGLHYGFFDVTYDNTPDFLHGTMTINGWAYDDVTDNPITTFNTSVPEPAVSGMMGLGLLAMGAAGLRRKRNQSRN